MSFGHGKRSSKCEKWWVLVREYSLGDSVIDGERVSRVCVSGAICKLGCAETIVFARLWAMAVIRYDTWINLLNLYVVPLLQNTCYVIPTVHVRIVY